MFINNLKSKFESDDVCLGTWYTIPSDSLLEIIGLSNFDFAVIDMEHGPFTFEHLLTLIPLAERQQLSPIVRVPSINSSSILRALDCGAHGIQVPHIKTKEDAEKVIEYVKYSPIGGRGLSPFTRAGGFSSEKILEHSDIQNDNTLIILNIEGVEGIENLDSILKLENIDVIFLGPYDISQSVGVTGDINHPKVRDLIIDAIKKINDANVIAGCYAGNVDEAKFMIENGIRYLTYHVDAPIIHSTFNAISKEIKKI